MRLGNQNGRSAVPAMLFAASVLAACGSASAPPAASVRAPIVGVIEAAPTTAQGTVSASGLVLYKRETALSFNVPGVIASIAVDEGQTVRAGQQLAALRLTAVQAGATEASAALETAERNLTRQRTLFERGIVSQARLDDAELQVRRARAASDAAGYNRETAVLVATASGVILRRQAEPAQVVGAGQPILVLGETAQGLIVRANVTSRQAAQISRGAAAQVRLDGDPTVRVGRVEQIAAKSDSATGVYDVEIRIDRPAGMLSGMVARVEITGQDQSTQAPSLRVPLLALLDARADQGVVYVVDDQSIARRRAIRTGGVIDDEVIVLEGLQPGERVIATGAAFVRDGEPVSLAPAATATP
ncbi:MAG: efflux RND transporter periplasmic adaptor subunit [Caulobacterales bacterium]